MAVTRNEQQDGIVLTPEQRRSRHRGLDPGVRHGLRNIAVGLAIALFVVLIYAVTIAKLGSGVLERPL